MIFFFAIVNHFPELVTLNFYLIYLAYASICHALFVKRTLYIELSALINFNFKHWTILRINFHNFFFQQSAESKLAKKNSFIFRFVGDIWHEVWTNTLPIRLRQLLYILKTHKINSYTTLQAHCISHICLSHSEACAREYLHSVLLRHRCTNSCKSVFNLAKFF